MGHVEAAHLEYYLPDGRVLLDDVSFRVGEGAAVALVGANGAGKTTLLRLIAGELKPDGGAVTVSGGLGVMPQFVGSVRDDRRCATCWSPSPGRGSGRRPRAVDAAELAIMAQDDEPAQLGYAQALSDWAEARRLRGRDGLGHVHHGARSASRTTGRSGARCARCPAASRSGWCSRRCCAAPTRCCCWTSRTTTSTCPASAGWRSGWG